MDGVTREEEEEIVEAFRQIVMEDIVPELRAIRHELQGATADLRRRRFEVILGGKDSSSQHL
jgi:hypothetical protein